MREALQIGSRTSGCFTVGPKLDGRLLLRILQQVVTTRQIRSPPQRFARTKLNQDVDVGFTRYVLLQIRAGHSVEHRQSYVRKCQWRFHKGQLFSSMYLHVMFQSVHGTVVFLLRLLKHILGSRYRRRPLSSPGAAELVQGARMIQVRTWQWKANSGTEGRLGADQLHAWGMIMQRVL